jgi:hypothetical protein
VTDANAGNDWSSSTVAQGLVAAAGRLEPGDAVAILCRALAEARGPGARAVLALSLDQAAARARPEDVLRAADTLVQTLARNKDQQTQLDLVRGLVALAPYLKPRDAIELLAQATTRATAYGWLRGALRRAAVRLRPGEALQAADNLMRTMAATDPDNQYGLADDLPAILSGFDRSDSWGRLNAIATAVGLPAGDPRCLLTAPAFLGTTLEPPPRLSMQELVDLLGRLPCVGPSRRAILDHLGSRYQRRFADQWDFVRFAQEQGLGLDFTRPAKRSQPPANAAAPEDDT